MSNAQRLYLYQLVLSKISQTKENLPRNVDYQLFLLQLQPLLNDTGRELQNIPQAIDRALNESSIFEGTARLKTFENRLESYSRRSLIHVYCQR